MAKLDSYFPLREFEENGLAHTFIDEFENDSFWEELTSRLSERDVINQLGSTDRFEQLPLQERIRLLVEREEFYNEEFVTHGLKHLILVRPRAKFRGRFRSSCYAGIFLSSHIREIIQDEALIQYVKV